MEVTKILTKFYESINKLNSEYINDIKIDENLILFQTILSQNDNFLKINNKCIFILKSLGLELEIKSGFYFIQKNKKLCFKKLCKGDMILLINDILPYDFFIKDNVNAIKILVLRISGDKNLLITDNFTNVNFKKNEICIKTKCVMVDDKKYLYIYATAFGNKLNNILEYDAHKFSNIIIDLRENFGGSFKEMVQSLNYFLRKNTTFLTLRGKNNKYFKYATQPKALREFNQILILISQQTVSSAEIFAAYLRQNTNSILIGEKSYGKNIIHKNMSLENGYNIAVPKYEVILDDNIFNYGLIPDIVLNDVDFSHCDITYILSLLEKQVHKINFLLSNN